MKGVRVRLASVILGVAVGVGLATGTSGPADAAAKKCYVGNWKLVSATGVYKGINAEGAKWNITRRGPVGTRLTLTRSIASYTFGKPGREYRKERFRDMWMDGYYQFKGRLQVGVKWRGDRKGTYATAYRTASGNAVMQFHKTKPQKSTFGAFKATKLVRRGADSTPVIRTGSFSCGRAKLTFTTDLQGVREGVRWKTEIAQTWRRI